MNNCPSLKIYIFQIKSSDNNVSIQDILRNIKIKLSKMICQRATKIKTTKFNIIQVTLSTKPILNAIV